MILRGGLTGLLGSHFQTFEREFRQVQVCVVLGAMRWQRVGQGLKTSKTRPRLMAVAVLLGMRVFHEEPARGPLQLQHS